MKNILLLGVSMLMAFISYGQDQTALWTKAPSISPDGARIAFSYQGNIYTVSRTGDDAKQITSHEAYETNPIWSNDGSKIAFSSRRHGNGDIYIVDAQGGTPTRLTFHSSGDTPYTFSNDDSKVIFGSSRLDHVNSVQFPSGVLAELYEVPVTGGREKQTLATPALDVNFSADGSKFLYHDRKGYEDHLRKHHISSVARDVWMYDGENHTQLTTWEGEDRNPIWKGNDRMFFLSERDGSFNVWKATIGSGKAADFKQISQFKDFPVRSLSMADNGMLCYDFNGEIYTQLETEAPKKVKITIDTDRTYNEVIVKLIKGGASDFEVSPNGKEIAFIVRGEVFVTAIDYSETKRITDTPEQERNLDFNSDGTKLMYSGERNGSWNIYEASLKRESEKYFYNATLIEESPVVETDQETFQAAYSPDDKEISYLENRTTIRVKNIASGKSRTVMPGNMQYSYSDGDQNHVWSPDSKWLLVEFFDNERWNSQVGLLNVNNEEMPIDITESGYGNYNPKFGMGGEMVYWASDKSGFRSHGSWGAQADVYALFLTEDAFQKFSLDKADYEFWKDNKKDEDEDADDDKDDKKKKDDDKEEKKEVEPIKVDWDGLQDRKVRLTIFSSFLSDYLMDEEGENLYFLTSTGDDTNLWRTQFKDKETKIFSQLEGGFSSLQFDKKAENIFLNNKGSLTKIDVKDGKSKGISFSSEMNLNTDAEREYMFEHAWRQFKVKFYLEDLHGVDWDMYKANYAKFLPHINNKTDFADVLSEMLGEVNASHTGARAYEGSSTDDRTAALGLYYDEDYTGDGLKIAEVMGKSPCINKDGKVKAGVIIEKIDGVSIKAGENYLHLLNRKAGDKVLISYKGDSGSWDEVVEPISRRTENQLAYERWIETREAEVEKLSGGKLGYVHVRGMNSHSFREVYSAALGKHNTKDALIVDTRFNGGGWLHDDLATFLSGEPYMQFVPRGQDNMGGEPLGKWQKPSCVIMSESNYSDAHMFPYTYKYFEIGKLIGMPVPGTGTAVWWEAMIDGTVFGIPQIGMRDVKTGELLENRQLEPDIKVKNEPGMCANKRDQQLEKAVEHLLGVVKE